MQLTRNEVGKELVTGSDGCQKTYLAEMFQLPNGFVTLSMAQQKYKDYEGGNNK